MKLTPEERRERERERKRRWNEANPDKVREQHRRWNEANPDKVRESQRRWNEANPDKRREYKQRWRQANLDAARARDLRSEKARQHGTDFNATFAAMWQAQNGRCYACGDPLIREKVTIDHDHSCCPYRKTCALCRRGLACNRCNVLFGMVGDDPHLLRMIADNFEPVLIATRARIAAAPRQEVLL